LCGARHDGSDIVKIISTTEGYGVPFTKTRRPAAAVKVANIDSSLFVELETVD